MTQVTHRAKMSGLFHELNDDRGDLLAKSRWSIETPRVARVSRSCCTLDGQLITASTPAATSFCIEASLPLAMSHLHNQNTNHHQNSFNQSNICQQSKCRSLTPNFRHRGWVNKSDLISKTQEGSEMHLSRSVTATIRDGEDKLASCSMALISCTKL